MTGRERTQTTMNQRLESEFEDASTLKVYYGRQKSQKKMNKTKSKFLKKFLIENISVLLERFPHSVKLHIMAAFIFFSIFKNSFKSLYELSFTKFIKCSFYEQYECFVLSSSIIYYFSSRASQGLNQQQVEDKKERKKETSFSSASFEIDSDIKQVIEFEKINIMFQKMIEDSSRKTMVFWEELVKKNCDVEKVFGLGVKIYKDFIDIRKKYKHLMQLNSNYLEVAYLYKLFVQLVLNFEIEMEDAKLEIKKIMTAKSMRKHNLKMEYKSIQMEDENGMIIISGNRHNFTDILAMNNKAERIFGYSIQDIIGQKLQKLLPEILVPHHDQFILNFIRGNRRINKENHGFLWGKHRFGFIVPIVMDINAYVNFEFNFCFIAFLKRSILLEFEPLKELLEYTDVFVAQTDSRGIKKDITRNFVQFIGFPLEALEKNVSMELFFPGIFDDEDEMGARKSKKMEFDKTAISRELAQYDIELAANPDDLPEHSEKKYWAIVWVNTVEIDNGRMVYKEVWFVLPEDDASYMDNTKNTTEYLTAMGEEGGGMNMSATYTDDREEICSIASVASFAAFDKERTNIINMLSNIKSQTVDETKPRQIEILQKSIILVFLSVISISVLVLVISLNRNAGFYRNIVTIREASENNILFSQVRTIFSTLVINSNSDHPYEGDLVVSDLDQYLREETYTKIEDMRVYQSKLDFLDFAYS